MAVIENKTFPCNICQQQIKLERNADNTGWIRWNQDGTKHEHPFPKKNFQGSSSKTLEKLEQLEGKIEALTYEVHALREELVKQRTTK